jgi:hypothetical protein
MEAEETRKVSVRVVDEASGPNSKKACPMNAGFSARRRRRRVTAALL